VTIFFVVYIGGEAYVNPQWYMGTVAILAQGKPSG